MSPLVSVCVDWKGEVEVEVEKRTSYPTWNVKISLIATYLEESKEDKSGEEEGKKMRGKKTRRKKRRREKSEGEKSREEKSGVG